MTASATAESAAEGLVTEDTSFLEELAGAGFEDMGSGATSVAYLGMVQPDSTVEDEQNPAGTWRNSATGRNYGTDVKVVVLAFRTVWNERESEAPYRTVGRYPVGGIEIETRQPPKGKRGYPKMVNPETGNEVQELFVYAVSLPDFPEDGVLYFNPTVGSMKTARSWNTQLKGQLLPGGAQAPIFGFQWVLTAGLTPNPQQPAKQVARFMKATRDSVVGRELFESSVKPQLGATRQSILAITQDGPDTEEPAAE